VGADISAPSAEHSELGDSPGLGVVDCSELGDSPGLRVGSCSALWDSLGPEDCSELGGSPGLGVGDRSALRDSPREQVRFWLAQEHWPAEHFGQLGPRSVQLLQYSTGTEVVR